MRRADITLTYSGERDIFIVDLTPQEELELLNLRDRGSSRLFNNTEDLYWSLVSKKFGKVIEFESGGAREAEYIDALVRFYDGTDEVKEEYDIYC